MSFFFLLNIISSFKRFFSLYRGFITSLKLSPNLRLKVKPPKKQMNLDQQTMQVMKLDKLLSLVRELPEDQVVKDGATTVAS